MTSMTLTEAQKKIVNDLHRFRVVNCGRRFGKTTLSVAEMVGKAVSKPDQIVVYIGPTYQQARDIAWSLLKKVAAPAAISIKETSPLEIKVRTKGGGESLISLRGWESIDTLRGMKIDFLVPDEVAMYRNFWENWHEVLRPTLTDTKGEALFLSTPKGFNHFYDLYNLENKDTDFKSFHFTSWDNPFLPREELQKAQQELPEDRFAQEYEADFRKTEGLVYKEFSRDKHLFKSDQCPKNFTESIAGIDFGYTNPTACVTIKKDFDNNFWVTQEYYKRNKTDVENAEYVASQKFNKVYPDPEAPSAIEELRRRGVNVRDVVKNKDSIKNGIDKIRELLKANRLRISVDCINLIQEFETYSYPDKRDMHNDDENPIKENDHALDALRYALSMYSEAIIKNQAHIFRPQITTKRYGTY